MLLFSENADLLRTMPEFKPLKGLLSQDNRLHPLCLKGLEMTIDQKLNMEQLSPDIYVDLIREPFEPDDRHTGEPC